MTAERRGDVADSLEHDYRAALETGDLEGLEDLLDPQVRWGPPDSPGTGCRNRREVLSWYRRGRAAGARATVIEISTHLDTLLVGLQLSGTARAGEAPSGAVERWQVVTVRDGQIVEIVGYDDRAAAARRAGME